MITNILYKNQYLKIMDMNFTKDRESLHSTKAF